MPTQQTRRTKPWQLPFGATPSAIGITFRVWAPHANSLSVKIADQAHPMNRQERGFFELFIPELSVGSDYLYVIDDKNERPDPASRHQPFGVHGPSRVVDPNAFSWNDSHWKGPQLKDYILYEIHTGTFTPEGTFEAIIPKLPHLKSLGINAITLMPVAQFPGERNWGYDGAYPYAPQDSYGGPEGLKLLIDSCHTEGIAVVMDVVYNHLGPEGNYLSEYGPYFTNKYRTAWGDAINFDDRHSDAVREYFLNNALYWINEYHVDALRLDAIQDIHDRSPTHILQEITEAIAQQERKAWTIAESNLNDTRGINPIDQGGYGIDAQWNDDFHHSIYTLITDSQHLYFSDFEGLQHVKDALEKGYVYDGKWSDFHVKTHGCSTEGCLGDQFVVFIQNHDQVANASATERLSHLATQGQHKLAAAILFCSANVPLLFMGQEWGSTSPFYYFTDHENQHLAEQVRKGYHYEYYFHAERGKDTDPQDPAIFEESKLQWDEIAESTHQPVLALYRDLIALRKQTPALSNCRMDLLQADISKEGTLLTVHRQDPSGSEVQLLCNCSHEPQLISIDQGWIPALSTDATEYGGKRNPLQNITQLNPWEALILLHAPPPHLRG